MAAHPRDLDTWLEFAERDASAARMEAARAALHQQLGRAARAALHQQLGR